jgi:hypothetical protein
MDDRVCRGDAAVDASPREREAFDDWNARPRVGVARDGVDGAVEIVEHVASLDW